MGTTVLLSQLCVCQMGVYRQGDKSLVLLPIPSTSDGMPEPHAFGTAGT